MLFGNIFEKHQNFEKKVEIVSGYSGIDIRVKIKKIWFKRLNNIIYCCNQDMRTIKMSTRGFTNFNVEGLQLKRCLELMLITSNRPRKPAAHTLPSAHASFAEEK